MSDYNKASDKRVYFVPDRARVVTHSELNRLLAKLTAKECAAYLGVSKETIFRVAKQANLIAREPKE